MKWEEGRRRGGGREKMSLSRNDTLSFFGGFSEAALKGRRRGSAGGGGVAVGSQQGQSWSYGLLSVSSDLFI